MPSLRIILLWIMTAIAFAARPGSDVLFKAPVTETPLSHYSAMALYQDERGLVWIGTRNGVNVYDGSDITSFYHDKHNPDNSLLSNSVRQIVGDKKGNIFFLTLHGVCAYNIDTEKFSTLTHNVPGAICYDDRLLIGSGSSVYFHDGSRFEKDLSLPDPALKISALASHADSLLIGTEQNGLYIFNRKTESLSNIMPKERIDEIFHDSKGNWWIGTHDSGVSRINSAGITQYRHSAADPASISSDFVRRFCEDPEGYIWVGTAAGLSRLDPQTGVFTNFDSVDQNANMPASVWSLMCDDQGTIWVGTYFNGVRYLNPGLDFYKFYKPSPAEADGLSFPVVGAMTEDKDGNLWIATEGGGLNMLNRSTGKFRRFTHSQGQNSISNDNVKSLLFQPESNTLWAGTHLGGLNRLDLSNHTFTNFSITRQLPGTSSNADIICDIVAHGDDELLLATHDGVYAFTISTGKFTPMFKTGIEGAIVDFALDLHIDRNGQLWIGGVERGAMQYDFNSHTLTPHYHNPGDSLSLSSNGITAINEDSNGNLWMCMAETGLDLYNPHTKNFKNFEYIGSSVYGVKRIDPETLLILTDKGFSTLNTATGAVRNFSSATGLPLSAINQNGLYQTRDGEIFIGGINGLISFRPEDLDAKLKNSRLFPFKLLVSDREVHPNDGSGILSKTLSDTREITLKPGQSSFSVQYAITNYAESGRDKISYRLRGLSDQWHTLFNGNIISFTNVPAGSYTLEVKTEPTDGTAPLISLLDVRVLAPWYARWWAIIIYLILGGLLLRYVIVTYQRRMRLQSQVELERRRTADVEKLSLNKLQFFTNISHEFRTPLTLITAQTEMLLKMSDLPQKAASRVKSVLSSSRQLQEMVTELLDFRKQDQGHLRLHVRHENIVDFLQSIFRLFNDYASQRKIKYHFSTSSSNIMAWFDPKQLSKVVNNLLYNAFQYTPEGGEITLSVRRDKHMAIFEVSDTGCGIASDELPKIFERFYQARSSSKSHSDRHGVGVGLALSQGIARLHHGEITVFSTEGEGTTFTVYIPLSRELFAPEEIDSAPAEAVQITQPVLQLPAPEEPQPLLAAEEPKPNKVLVADDNAEMRKMLTDLLSPFYSVVTAENGKDALEKIQNCQPDLVITDLLMPEMSGLELCRSIKQNPQTLHIPVIMLTAVGSDAGEVEGLRTGADAYFKKPFDTELLLTRCNTLIGNRQKLEEKYRGLPKAKAATMATSAAMQEFIDKATAVVEANLANENFSVVDFASEMAVARTALFERIKQATQLTPNEFIIDIRMRRAAALLLERPDLNVTQISEMLGFSTPRYFSRCFKERYGLPPLAYRSQK